MKTAASSVCTSSRISSGSSSFGCPVRADDRAGKHRLENGDEEMQACFVRLMQLVPTIPPNGRMSKVQLLQHVIDYILDLEHTLDFVPSGPSLHQTGVMGKTAGVKRTEVGSAGTGSSVSSPPSTTTSSPPQTVDRKPLTENVQVNSYDPNYVHQTFVRQSSTGHEVISFHR